MPKPRTFEILITCFTTVVVEAEDEERALETASNSISLRGVSLDEMSIDEELKSPEEIQRAIDSSEYHRDDFRKTPYGNAD
jgi:hypothetical protein